MDHNHGTQAGRAWQLGGRPGYSLGERNCSAPLRRSPVQRRPCRARSGPCRSSPRRGGPDPQRGTACLNFGCHIPTPTRSPHGITASESTPVRRRCRAERDPRVGAAHDGDIKGREGALVPPKRSAEEVVSMLREIERLTGEGMPVTVAASRLGITDKTYYRWRAHYGSMPEGEASQLQTLEQENARLKRLAADQARDISMLREMFGWQNLSPAQRTGIGRPLGPPLRNLRAPSVRARRPEPVHPEVRRSRLGRGSGVAGEPQRFRSDCNGEDIGTGTVQPAADPVRARRPDASWHDPGGRRPRRVGAPGPRLPGGACGGSPDDRQGRGKAPPPDAPASGRFPVRVPTSRRRLSHERGRLAGRTRREANVWPGDRLPSSGGHGRDPPVPR